MTDSTRLACLRAVYVLWLLDALVAGTLAAADIATARWVYGICFGANAAFAACMAQRFVRPRIRALRQRCIAELEKELGLR